MQSMQNGHQLAGVLASLEVSASQPTLLHLGVSRSDVETAFTGWQVVAVEPADTTGLGWPMNRTQPQWYRLRRRPPDHS